MRNGTVTVWQPPTRLVKSGSKKGRTLPNNLYPIAWIQELRTAIAAVDPDIDAKLYTSHSLRSGAATALVEAGGSIDDARQLLNHKSDGAVIHYVKSGDKRSRKLAGSLLAFD